MSPLPRADVLLSQLVESFLGVRAGAVVPATKVIPLAVAVVASLANAHCADAPLRESLLVDGVPPAYGLGILVGKEGFN